MMHLWEAMQEQHEGLGGVSAGDIVELDAVGLHVLVLAQAGVQHTGRGHGPLVALEEAGGMADYLEQSIHKGHCIGH